jgi:hypothetical protein
VISSRFSVASRWWSVSLFSAARREMVCLPFAWLASFTVDRRLSVVGFFLRALGVLGERMSWLRLNTGLNESVKSGQSADDLFICCSFARFQEPYLVSLPVDFRGLRALRG